MVLAAAACPEPVLSSVEGLVEGDEVKIHSATETHGSTRIKSKTLIEPPSLSLACRRDSKKNKNGTTDKHMLRNAQVQTTLKVN